MFYPSFFTPVSPPFSIALYLRKNVREDKREKAAIIGDRLGSQLPPEAIL